MLQLCLGGLQLRLGVAGEGLQGVILNPEGLQQMPGLEVTPKLRACKESCTCT